MAHNLHTVILYHGKCPDGFGGAYAAWKKYGETAEYIPVKHGGPIPEDMDGREIFLVDFCFPQAGMDALKAVAESVTVLDHHEGIRDVATQFPGVFDPQRSGATIAWAYFHPDTPTPKLMTYLEDGDNYRYELPETRDLFSYLGIYPYEFEKWDELATTLDDEAASKVLLQKAAAYTEYFYGLADISIASAKKIRFEGHEVRFAISHPIMSMKSYVGNKLYEEYPPFALVVSAHPDGFGVSIRGDGSVDVAKIAQKYGGNGHPKSAGFFIPWGDPLPWEEITDED